MLRVFTDAGFQVERRVRRRRGAPAFPIAPTARLEAVQRPASSGPRRARSPGCSRPRVRRGLRGAPRRHRRRRRLLRHLAAAASPDRSYPVHPSRVHVGGLPAYRVGRATRPADRPGGRRGAGGGGAVRRGGLRRGRRARAGGRLGRVRRGGTRPAPQAQAALLRSPAATACAWSARTASASPTPTRPSGSTRPSRRCCRRRAGSGSSASPPRSASRCSPRPTGAGSACPRFVSAGNRADVSGNDLLQYWRDDPHTDVVLLYLETFGNPRKFARIARELARHKPVVAVASRGAGRRAWTRVDRPVAGRARRRRAVRQLRRDPGRHRRRAVRRRRCCWPRSRCRPGDRIARGHQRGRPRRAGRREGAGGRAARRRRLPARRSARDGRRRRRSSQAVRRGARRRRRRRGRRRVRAGAARSPASSACR